ncbi:MAG: trigger factor [Acidobacteria bacterium]|nr:trigger factor [Acidobacteriota bacterium]
MLIEYKDVTSVKKFVGVEIPAGAVDHEFKHVLDEFSRQARIPGFRAGKVPRAVVRTKFDDDIKREVLDRLLPRFLRDAIVEKGLEAVGTPELKQVADLVEGSPLRFDAELEVRPAVALSTYRGLEVAVKPFDVFADEVAKTIERFREQSGTFRGVSDRAAVEGDYVVVDLVSTAEGMERKTTEGYYVHLGPDTVLPELREALTGRSPGDNVSFEKTWDDEAPNEDVRGKTVRYDVTVKEIQLRELPELNDEFARGTGFAESLDDLRTKVEDDMRRHKEQESTNDKRKQLGDALVAAHSFDVPDALVDDETVKALRNYARFLSSQGVDVEKAPIDWENLRAEFRPDAVKRVQLSAILDAIAKQEGLAASDADVDDEIRKGVSNASEFSSLKRRLQHDGTYEEIRRHVAEEKAFQLVIAEAKAS